jgi:hypothetical protein
VGERLARLCHHGVGFVAHASEEVVRLSACHRSFTSSVTSLPHIIRRLRERRLRLVTVAQLVRDDPPPCNQRAPRNLSGG